MKNILVKLSVLIFIIFNVFLTKHTVNGGVINKNNDNHPLLTLSQGLAKGNSNLKGSKYRFEYYTQGSNNNSGVEALGGVLGQAYAYWTVKGDANAASLAFRYTVDKKVWLATISLARPFNGNVELFNDFMFSSSKAFYNRYIKGTLKSQKSDKTYFTYAVKVYDQGGFRGTLALNLEK